MTAQSLLPTKKMEIHTKRNPGEPIRDFETRFRPVLPGWYKARKENTGNILNLTRKPNTSVQ